MAWLKKSQREKMGLASIAALVFLFAQALGCAHAAHEHDDEFSISECAVCNLKTHDDDAIPPGAVTNSSHLSYSGAPFNALVLIQYETVQPQTVRTRGPPLA